MTATFEKVGTSDQTMYGPRKLLLCGFAAEAQAKFAVVLKAAGMEGIARVWASAAVADMVLGNLMALPGGSGEGVSSDLPRAIIMGGITEKEMHRLMGTCRQAGMRSPLWAVLTPASEKWTLRSLLDELASERDALRPQGE